MIKRLNGTLLNMRKILMGKNSMTPHPEKHLSQIPALQLLANLGYQVLTSPATKLPS